MNSNTQIFLNGLSMMVLSAAKRLREKATTQAIVSQFLQSTGKVVKVESVHTAALRLCSRGLVEIDVVRGAGASGTNRRVSVIRISEQGLEAREKFLREMLSLANAREVEAICLSDEAPLKLIDGGRA